MDENKNKPTESAAVHGQRRILVAEDNETNRQLLELQLNMLGFEADFVNDGAEAFEFWQNGNYVLLLTDIHMPIMGGYELVNKIRTTKRYAESNMKIVAISADENERLVKGCEESGIDDFITKPVLINVLKEKLKQYLPGDSSHSETDNSTPISMDELKKIIGNDLTIIHRLLHKFVQSASVTVKDIYTAHAKNDTESVATLVYKLKSGARSMGAVKLGDTCQNIENSIKEKDWVKTNKLVFTLNDLIDEVQIYVEKHHA